MREGYVSTNSGKIWYSVYGENKPETPLLVVHGGPGFLSMPETISDFSVNRPVYFYDQLGSGKSDIAESLDYYSVENFVQELEDVRRELNLSEVILMGHSWGCGLVCSYMLDKKPKGVKSLVLSSPFLSAPHFMRDAEENISKLPEQMIRVIQDSRKNKDYGDEYQGIAMEYLMRYSCILRPVPPSLMEAFSKINEEVYSTMWGPSEFDILGKLSNFDLSPNLHNISVPILLTCGDRDEISVKTMTEYQMTFPMAQLAVLPNASHMHFLEQPEIYKTIVNTFFQK